MTLLDGYKTLEEELAELKEMIENRDSKDSSPMTESEKELIRRQSDVTLLESEIAAHFPDCWTNYETDSMQMKIKEIKRLAAEIERKEQREKEKATEGDDKSQVLKTENETADNEKADERGTTDKEDDNDWIDLLDDRRAAEMLREAMGDLPQYEEWLKTLKQSGTVSVLKWRESPC